MSITSITNRFIEVSSTTTFSHPTEYLIPQKANKIQYFHLLTTFIALSLVFWICDGKEFMKIIITNWVKLYFVNIPWLRKRLRHRLLNKYNVASNPQDHRISQTHWLNDKYIKNAPCKINADERLEIKKRQLGFSPGDIYERKMTTIAHTQQWRTNTNIQKEERNVSRGYLFIKEIKSGTGKK